jgi:alkyl sulfatase BDS1-like metallo-beta-lactamase superfamily hydrolase
MQFIHVPSEAPDEIAIFLPRDNILLSAETIQGPTLPNIHTLRGTKFRDPVAWVRSIDRLRAFKAANMVPSHGQPVIGAEKVEEVLRMTRDGIQFVHDQTIRHMNKGLTPDELAVAIKFPPHLRDYAPYLREYYGTLPHSVRQIYTGYLGWFDGDPVNLAPTPPNRLAQNHIDLMGGRDAVFSAAEIAYSQDDFQWAAELTTYIIRVDHSDEPARQLKAACLRQLGYASMNINWRNWYLTSAQELEGNINALQALGAMSQNFSSPDVIAAWPASVLVGGLPPRLKAEDTLDRHLTVGFEFTDTQDAYAIEIRNGVAQFHETMPAATDAKLSLTKQVFLRIGAGRLSLADAIANGELAATGDVALVEQFFASFEPLAQEINLTVR